MADYKFSFHEKGKEFNPAWMAPEGKLRNISLVFSSSLYGACDDILALQRKANDLNQKAADMWSYAVVLWELCTREVPFAELSPMEIGMKVREK